MKQNSFNALRSNSQQALSFSQPPTNQHQNETVEQSNQTIINQTNPNQNTG